MLEDQASLLDKTLPQIDKNSWIHKWESRCKAVTCVLSIFLIASMESPILLMGIYLTLLVMVLSMGLSVRELIRRTAHLLPFIILMALPIILGGGFPLKRDRILLATLLALKSLSGLYIMFILFFSQSIPKLLNALSYMKIPDVFMSIMFLTLRYIFILGEKLRNMYKALISRLFKPALDRKTFNAMGGVVGGILIKSFDTSDIVYKAMISRGFNGKMPVSKPEEIKLSDLLKSGIILIVIIFILILERRWFV